MRRNYTAAPKTMEDEEVVLLVILLYFFANVCTSVTDRRLQDVYEKIKNDRKARARKRRRLLRRIAEIEFSEAEIWKHKQKKLHRQLYARRGSSPVWMYNRTADWWETVAPSFAFDQ